MPKMPIDIKKLLNVVSTLKEESGQVVKVDLVFDPTASDALIDMVFDAFLKTESNAKVKQHVLEGAIPALRSDADLCVIVGGNSPMLGDVAAAARANETPAVVVIGRGETFFTSNRNSVKNASDATLVASTAAETTAGQGISIADLVDIDVHAGGDRPLEDLAKWIVSRTSGKGVAMAEDFPFLRHAQAVETINSNAIENGAIGLVFFMPGADMPLITLNQARMVMQIAAIYGHPIDKQRIKEIAAVVAGGFGFRALARKLVAEIPVIGWVARPGVAAGATVAMGYAAIECFEEGGKFTGLSEAVDKGIDLASDTIGKIAKTALSKKGASSQTA